MPLSRKKIKVGLIGVVTLGMVITLFVLERSSTQQANIGIVTKDSLYVLNTCMPPRSDATPREEVRNDTETIFIGRSPCLTHNVSKLVNMPQCQAVVTSSARKLIPIDVIPQTLEALEGIHGKRLELGGMYTPQGCAPVQRVAIVVPYRDRTSHLKIFLKNVHYFLKKQGIQYMIIVVEQAPGSRFNRGMSRNIGFVEGEKLCGFDCYVFHDIDLIPQVDANAYICDDMPRFHSINLERWNHRIPPPVRFGGVVSFKPDVFRRVNGYSNMYFDWGGEDDDIYYRVRERGYHVVRYPMNASLYLDLTHPQSWINPSRFNYLRSGLDRMTTDGLNSLKYRRYLVDFRGLYTWIYAGIDEREVLQNVQQRQG
ncbi:beta-1,4-N-acetylgalactosaminyltransferase bre-4-like [Haliotis cracherodii]|uniref:beta-1,4-N-acetylgalactosaminyltransferase bre-4-like n=1 Tax=Haliotis cracherodii TaxID=6455 RepID=UPI0039EC38A0